MANACGVSPRWARPLIDARFYDTYHFVGWVHEILSDPWSHLRLVNDFNCDGQHFSHSLPFPRYSALLVAVGKELPYA
jgi:hypothetical protein